jgi:uncharacterized membrane protein
MTRLWRKLRTVVLAGACVIYVLLGYLASASNHPPILAVIVGALPLAAGVVTACWQSSFRWPAMAACTGAITAIALNINALLAHASWLYFIQHVGAMGSLAIMFGSTLRTHEGALCSRIAKIAITDALDARYLHYTWKVTLCWTLYFVASGIISTTLFCMASLRTWAFFAAVLTPVSLGIMFAGEFLIRLRALPGRPHFSIARTIQSYRQYTLNRNTPTAFPSTCNQPQDIKPRRRDEPDTTISGD